MEMTHVNIRIKLYRTKSGNLYDLVRLSLMTDLLCHVHVCMTLLIEYILQIQLTAICTLGTFNQAC